MSDCVVCQPKNVFFSLTTSKDSQPEPTQAVNSSRLPNLTWPPQTGNNNDEVWLARTSHDWGPALARPTRPNCVQATQAIACQTTMRHSLCHKHSTDLLWIFFPTV